jgi:hypothetical protein
MLQRIQSEIGEARGVSVPINAEHTAFFAEFVVPGLITAFEIIALRRGFQPGRSTDYREQEGFTSWSRL